MQPETLGTGEQRATDHCRVIQSDVGRASRGRVYGGGLHKVEPNEQAQIPASSVLDSVGTQMQIEQQGALFT
jgi:hypothetical protein